MEQQKTIYFERIEAAGRSVKTIFYCLWLQTLAGVVYYIISKHPKWFLPDEKFYSDSYQAEENIRLLTEAALKHQRIFDFSLVTLLSILSLIILLCIRSIANNLLKANKPLKKS